MAGRRTKYRERYANIAYSFCLLGADDKFVASAFGVNVSTIYRWRAKYPDFANRMQMGKNIADAEVAAALFKLATGFYHSELTYWVFTNKKGTETAILIKEVVKYHPPNPLAMIFWLKNRQPELWRDKPEGKQPEDEKPKPLWLTSDTLDESSDES